MSDASTTTEAAGGSGAGAAVEIAGRDLIGGSWRELSGEGLVSQNPAHPDRVVWRGTPRVEHVREAVEAAQAALPAWRVTPIEKRIETLRAYQEIVRSRVEEIADLLSAETGKALWDATTEAKALAGKVDVTLEQGPTSGRARVAGFDLELSESRRGLCRFRPHGVMAVVGPFNFPAHLPNGHIVPALLMGNTVVFKPSDKTPAVGQLLASLFQEALEATGGPKGVVNLVQGGADVASALVTDAGVNGIAFTGSWPVGRKILEANLDTPGRIVALELGGNNPAIVMKDADLRQAAIECARAAFITTGQRCTCTRRLIVEESIAREFTALVAKIASNLIVGDPRGIGGGSRNQPVFMGPVISPEARDTVLGFQRSIAKAGAEILVEATDPEHPSGGHYVTPGVAMVDTFTLDDGPGADAGCDVEIFGPYLRVAAAKDYDHAIELANTTRYGLASSIFTNDRSLQERFLHEAQAGCVNVNAGTAGASGKLPFGGLGLSGNHRPAGAFALDYCAYPVASMVEDEPTANVLPGMHFDDSWLNG
jgi:succinylglutamic semialdehyde dehydrogenase